MVPVALLFCVSLCLMARQAVSQADVFVHPLTNMAPAHEEIETGVMLPDHPDKKLPLGEIVTVLCQVQNNADAPFNISAIMGSLNLVHDFNFHIQNFSFTPFGSVVRPGEEITLDYRIMLDPRLMPEEYTVAATVFYTDGKAQFSNTFFNETIESYSMEDGMDILSLAKLIFAMSLSVFVAYVMWVICGPQGKDGKKLDEFLNTVSGVAAGAASPVKKAAVSESDDWLKD